MHLDLTDEEAAALILIQELHDIVENDRYPFSPLIRTLRSILGKLRSEPVRGVDLRSRLERSSTQPLPTRKCMRRRGRPRPERDGPGEETNRG
jgi:hypothetical protein